MYTDLRLISLLGVLSLTLMSLAGCGEKRIHVSTASGAPGDEIALEPLDETSGTQTAGLSKALVNESDLSSQLSDDGNVSGEPIELDMGNEPINMAHESTDLSKQVVSPDSSSFGNQNSGLGNGLSDHESSFDPLVDGQDFSTQSSSSKDNPLSRSTVSNAGESDSQSTLSLPKDSSVGFADALSG